MSNLDSEIDELVQFDMGQHDKDCGVTITRDYGNCDCNKLELKQAIKALYRQKEQDAHTDGYKKGYIDGSIGLFINRYKGL